MQTQKGSAFEVCCNVGSGVLSAYLAWRYIVLPWRAIIGCDLNNLVGFGVIAVNLTFTLISVVRGYFWRRLFNSLEQRSERGVNQC